MYENAKKKYLLFIGYFYNKQTKQIMKPCFVLHAKYVMLNYL